MRHISIVIVYLVEVFVELLEQTQLQLKADVGIDASSFGSDERESVVVLQNEYT